MSLPPNPQTRYSLSTTAHQTRKPVFKCLPEIHASRLAVSGSLRPKLGLLLLLVVILVSLCFLLIPILSKISISRSKTPHIHTLPLIDVFDDLHYKSSSTILFTPDLLVSSLAMVSGSTSSTTCGVVHKNTSSTRLGGKIFRRGEALKYMTKCPEIEVVEISGIEPIKQWLRVNDVNDVETIRDIENVLVDKTAIVTTANVRLTLEYPSKSSPITGHWVDHSGSLKPVKFTQIAGMIKMATFPTYDVVLLDMLQDNLELYLLLPHSKREHKIGAISWEDISLSEYGSTSMEILLPNLFFVSTIELTPSLHILGKGPEDTSVFQHVTLQLLPSVSHSGVQHNKTRREFKHNSITERRLVFDHDFFLMVRELGMEFPVLVGRISG